MGQYLKILFVIFGVAYFISPLDIIPDQIIPYFGWLDDGLIIATIIYYFKHGKLPSFLAKGKRFSKLHDGVKNADYQSKNQEETGKNNNDEDEQTQGDYSREKTPWEILGVNPRASKKEIQTAFKAAVKKYHPDKVSHLGDEFSDLANDKFLEIKKAYDFLMKHI
jgi:uncharacterized membrane protein YkvA (DUF1232 family)